MIAPKLHSTIHGVPFPAGTEWDARYTSSINPQAPMETRGRWVVRRDADRFVVFFFRHMDGSESLLAEYPPTDQGELDAKSFALLTERTTSSDDQPKLPDPKVGLDVVAFYAALDSLTRNEPDGNIFIPDALPGYALLNEMPTFVWNDGRVVHTLAHQGGFEWKHTNLHRHPAPELLEDASEPFEHFYNWVIADLTHLNDALEIDKAICQNLGYLSDRGHAAFALECTYEPGPEIMAWLTERRISIEGRCTLPDARGHQIILLHQPAQELAASAVELENIYKALCISQFSNDTKQVLQGKIVSFQGKTWVSVGGSPGLFLDLHRVIPWDGRRRPRSIRSYNGIVFKVGSDSQLFLVTGEQATATLDRSRAGLSPRVLQLSLFA